MVPKMTDDRPSEVLGGLPRTRPHRRSDKRAARAPSPAAVAPTAVRPAPRPAAPKPTATGKPTTATKPTPTGKLRTSSSATAAARRTARTKPARLAQPEQPAGAPPAPASRKPAPSTGVDILGTTVQAAAELAEIGLSASARALRGAISRLPRP